MTTDNIIINSVPNVVLNLHYTSTGDGNITVYWNVSINNEYYNITTISISHQSITIILI